MFPLTINGIGPVGAFGAGLADFKDALTGSRKITPEITRVTTQNGDCDLPVFRADTKPLAEFIKPRKLRRLDNFSRMALLGSALAVADSAVPLNGSRAGLIVASAHGASATTFAFLDSVIDDGDALASPTLFSNSVHNAAAAHIAEHFQITGPTLSLTQGRNSLAPALLTAALWLQKGLVDTVLCGVVDCYCEVLGYCWQSYQPKCRMKSPELIFGPGEGSFFLRLSRTEKTFEPAKYGYLKRLEFDRTTLPETPFICSGNCGRYPLSADEMNPGKRLPFDTTSLCGHLPVAAGFDLAAAIALLHNQESSNGREKSAAAVLPSPTICCWEPRIEYRRKPLTGNCYWVTNHADLNLRKQA